MPAISGKKKCRQCRQIRAGKKMPVFSGGDKIAGKPAIAREVTGLRNILSAR